jgi:flagellar biosynthesis GTPase FlhF
MNITVIENKKTQGKLWVFLFIILFMKKFINRLLISIFLVFISASSYSGGDDISVLQEELDMVLINDPCFDQLQSDIDEDSNLTSVIRLKGEGLFSQGDEIMSSSNVKAIAESYDPETKLLTYYQTAKTGFRSFSIGDKLVGKDSNVFTIEEFVIDLVVPCSDLVVSIEENPEQMIFIFSESKAALKAKLAAEEMMAEIEEEMARQAALEAFQQKLEEEKAAAAKSTAAYQSKLARDAAIAARMAELALEKELAAFEAQLEAELAAQEMMAEIEEEMARQAALEAFQQKLEEEKAAAAASTAKYQAKVAYEKRVTKIMDDLLAQLDEFNVSGEHKSNILDEIIKEATLKLEEEAFVGAISGEIVTEAIHDYCKVNLGLSESNIELFKKALAGGYLGNVGPQIEYGTEFTISRWQKYIDCVGSKR